MTAKADSCNCNAGMLLAIEHTAAALRVPCQCDSTPVQAPAALRKPVANTSPCDQRDAITRLFAFSGFDRADHWSRSPAGGAVAAHTRREVERRQVGHADQVAFSAVLAVSEFLHGPYVTQRNHARLSQVHSAPCPGGERVTDD